MPVRLGYLLPTREKIMLGEPAAAPLIDLAARAERLGVGIAADVPNIRAEFAACGVPFDKRVGRMMEGLRLMRALWTGQPVDWDGRWNEIKAIAREAGRDPGALTGSMYLNICLDEDAQRASARLDDYLERYYGQPAAVVRKRQAGYAGPVGGVAEFLKGYVAAGCTHLVLRFVGDHERHLETIAALREKFV